MSKVKIKLSKEYNIGGDVLSGEIELETPTMATMVDASSLCPPTNQIGFGVAIVAVVLAVPFNQVKAMNPKEFMALQDELKEILPN